MQHRLGVFRVGYETAVPAVVRAGIETACFDSAGKALKRPIHSLLGGKVRDRIETEACLFFRYRSTNGRRGGENAPQAMIQRCRELVGKHGFRVLKLNGDVLPPEEELETIRLLCLFSISTLP